MTELDDDETELTKLYDANATTPSPATSFPLSHPTNWQNCSALPFDFTERRGVGGQGRRGVFLGELKDRMAPSLPATSLRQLHSDPIN
jgi:hypothetical protein